MSPLVATLLAELGQIVVSQVKELASDPVNQDKLLDQLENFVESTTSKTDDKYALPTFRAIRLALNIQETDPRYADEVLPKLKIPKLTAPKSLNG